jgi:hypothetical protein
MYGEPVAGSPPVTADVGATLSMRNRKTTVVIVVSLAVALGGLVLLIGRQGEWRRERARRTACVSNLKHIGLSIRMYADDHGGAFPDDLSDISPYLAHQAKLFACPSLPLHIGPMADVEAWGDYIYIKGFMSDSPPDSAIVLCRPGNHGVAGVNVLFQDIHCEWVEVGDLVVRLAEKQERSNKAFLSDAVNRARER